MNEKDRGDMHDIHDEVNKKLSEIQDDIKRYSNEQKGRIYIYTESFFQRHQKDISSIGCFIMCGILCFGIGFYAGYEYRGKDISDNGISIDQIREEYERIETNQQRITDRIREAENTNTELAKQINDSRNEISDSREEINRSREIVNELTESTETSREKLIRAGKLLEENESILERVRRQDKKGE